MATKSKDKQESCCCNQKQNGQLAEIPDIIIFNVGGKKFTTTKNTLFSIPDTFFTALLSGRMSSLKDETGAYFIDRDPDLFAIILNYLRTNRLFDVNENNVDMLKHEAEYYSLAPLVQKFKLYKNLVENPTCGGNIVFQSLVKTNMNTKVKQIIPYDGGLVLVFDHYVKCYRLSDYDGWQCVFASKYIENEITLVAFHLESLCTMAFWLAICSKRMILQMNRGVLSCFNLSIRSFGNVFYKPSSFEEIGRFSLKDCPIDSMFFIGSQLVALNKENARVGIWNNSRWFVQDLKQKNVSTITAFDKAESDYLFLCSNHGVIYLIDMQKFPLRLKDGDLLINEFYKDPENEEITAISCYHCSSQSNEYFGFGIEKSIEIAYGTKNGTVRVLGHHPETGGQGPTLFQTVQVHLAPISRIMLNNFFLITICNQLHVHTCSLVRFRGLISTQPGTKSYSSFKICFFGDEEENISNSNGNNYPNNNDDKNSGPISISSHTNSTATNVGPYGYQREGDRQVLIEMPRIDGKYVNILNAANGQKICTLKSVDDSRITAFSITYKQDTRYGQYIATGHENGNIQVWDLTIAQELQPKDNQVMVSSWTISKKELIKNLFANE